MTGDQHRPTASLLRQVGVALALLILAFAVFNTLIVVWMYSRDLPQLAHDVVRMQAEEISRKLAAGEEPLPPPATRAWHWTVRREDGTLVAQGGDRSLPLPTTAVGVTSTNWRLTDGSPEISGLTRVAAPGRPQRWVAVSIVAHSMAVFRPAIFRELIEHVVLPLTPLMAALLVGVLLMVSRLTATLRQAARQAQALDPGDPAARLSTPASPREVRRLVQAVNGALERLEANILAVRDFTANAAHELRTPLAVMRLGVQDLEPSPSREALSKEVAALSRTVSQLLDLTQTAAIPDLPATAISLRDIAADQIAQLVRLAWREDRDIQLLGTADATVTGHPEAIGRALRNILENALAHTPPGTAVEVSIGPGETLSVRDHGPGVPEALRERIFDRFWRRDRSKSGGAGLGLGIVAATMAAHGGRVEVGDGPGGGAVFTLVFPAGSNPLQTPQAAP